MTRKRLGCSWVPDLIFHPACVWHDGKYDWVRGLEGLAPWELDVVRYSVDREYLELMLKAVRRQGKHRVFYTAIAYLYYAGVRAFGWYALKENHA